MVRSPAGKALAGLLMLLSAGAASAQSLPQQNQQILDELKAIRALLERLAGPIGAAPAAPAAAPAVPESVRLTAIKGAFLGKADAPLTMVEFTDLQCPFCRQFHLTSFEQIRKEYIDTGKLRYYSLDFPLENIHPLAMTAARAARCAAGQNRFWEMRHAILLNNAKLTPDVFATFARDLNINLQGFDACAGDESRFREEIQRDMATATTAGVTGTPSFVIGRSTPDGVDGALIVGAQPYASFDARLQQLLKEK